MNSYEHDELFHPSGPEESLNYLWGRLQDRDLSQEEALALLSAVHRQLTTSRGGDPKAYFTYSRFMESLSREMPVVHDFVVARWIESRRAGRREPTESSDAAAGTLDEDDPAILDAPTPAAVAVRPAIQSPPVVRSEADAGEEPEEPGESGEDDGETQAETRIASPRREATDPEGQDEAAATEEQAEEESRGEDGDAPEQQDDVAVELEDQVETTEALAGETPEAEEPEIAVAAEDEAPADAEPPAAEAEQAGDDQSAGEPAGRPVMQEGEWPAEEALEPAEPAEEMEGEGDEPSPAD